MNKRCAGALLLACAVLPARAGRIATEAEWIAAASQAVAYGKAQGMPIELEIERGDGLSGHTPIGLWSANGRCTLVVSARDNPSADKKDGDLFLLAGKRMQLSQALSHPR